MYVKISVDFGRTLTPHGALLVYNVWQPSTAVDMALVNLGLAGILTLVRRCDTLTNIVFAAYKTPVWYFAPPYSGKPSDLRLQYMTC